MQQDLDKDYDVWNAKKKDLSRESKRLLFKEGEIWWCSVGINVGIESFGKGDTFRRPVLVIKKLNHESCIGIPLTSKERSGTWFQEISFHGQKNWAMINQIRMFDTKRFQRRLTVLEESGFLAVKEKLQKLLELPLFNHPPMAESVGNPKNTGSLSKSGSRSQAEILDFLYSCHNAPMSHAYIFYGKAGSGKGTQAKLLTEKLNSESRSVITAETGSMLRAFANEPGFIQQKTRETMSQGLLTPVFLASYTWANALIARFTGVEDIVFDGVARRIEEAPILDSAIEYLGFEKVFIFLINISDETAIERMRSRATIAGSSARADDVDVAAAQARLDAFRTQVSPVIEYFKAHPVYRLIEIDGEADVHHVFEQIKAVIG